MKSSMKQFFGLTAADLMSRDVVSVPATMHVRDALHRLKEANVHGATVIEPDGRCAGVLSLTDIVRWTTRHDRPHAPLPQTCRFQDKIRERDGEKTLCVLHRGACPLQQEHTQHDGTKVTICAEPNCVPVDWQMVEFEALPDDDVRHYMTTCAVTAAPDATIIDLAQRMADWCVQRVIILDDDRRPLGIVSSSDLIVALSNVDAEPDESPVGHEEPVSVNAN